MSYTPFTYGPVNSYLRLQDYQRIIAQENLSQVVNNTDSLRVLAEQSAVEEMLGYLVQKFWVQGEFTATGVYDPSTAYGGGSRAELNFPPFSQAVAYEMGDLVTYGGQEFACVVNESPAGAGPFDPADWYLLGNQYDLFYLQLPYPAFDCYRPYLEGARVFWNGAIYQAQQASLLGPDHEAYIQATTYFQNNPFAAQVCNYFPGVVSPPSNLTAAANSMVQWGVGTPYTVAGYEPYNTGVTSPLDPPADWDPSVSYSQYDPVTYNGVVWESLVGPNLDIVPGADIVSWQSITWVLGDNRSQKLVEVAVDLTLFNLHARIAPRNIPELRRARYATAKEWLDSVANGRITPVNLQLLQPWQGTQARYGGNTRVDFTW